MPVFFIIYKNLLKVSILMSIINIIVVPLGKYNTRGERHYE